MAKAALTLPASERASRAPRVQVARLTLYKDGIGKLTRTAMEHLGNPTQVSLLHDTEDPQVVYISKSGEFAHKLSKQGSFSAAPLHRHAGSPDRPMKIDLHVDADGDLRGDLSAATWGEPRAPRAKVNGSDAAVATGSTSSPRSSVEGGTVAASGSISTLPDASAPSDTSEDDDEEYDDEDDDLYEDDDVEATASTH